MSIKKSKMAATLQRQNPGSAAKRTEAEKAEHRRCAKLAIDPASSGVATMRGFSKGAFGDGDPQAIYEATADKIQAVRDGSMRYPEGLLVSQATSLNLIFNELARRAALNMGEYIEAADRYMRLALKAQAQSRATIETLAALKNPPVVFARQANIAAGHQQINNHMPAPLASPAANSEDAQNKLLEAQHGEEERMDGRAKAAAATSDSPLDALAQLDGPADADRKGAFKPER
jgi:hypothetical protein